MLGAYLRILNDFETFRWIVKGYLFNQLNNVPDTVPLNQRPRLVQIEAGKTDNPSLDKVVAIAEALGVPLAEIVYGEDKSRKLSFSDLELDKLKEAKDSIAKLRDALDILLSKI